MRARELSTTADPLFPRRRRADSQSAWNGISDCSPSLRAALSQRGKHSSSCHERLSANSCTREAVIRESRLVFRWADAPDGIPARIRRAELQVGTTLVACGRSAAGLYGFGVLTDGRLHVTTASARSMVAPASVVIHQQILRSAPMQCHGCRATDPGDTAVDVATSYPRIDVWPVFDAALRAGLPSSDLRAAIDRAARAARYRFRTRSSRLRRRPGRVADGVADTISSARGRTTPAGSPGSGGAT